MRPNHETHYADRERTHDDRHGIGSGSDLFGWGGYPRSRRNHPNTDHRGWEAKDDDYERRRRDAHHSQSHSEDVDPRFGADAHRGGMPRDESRRLIASRKVEGTPVYDRVGNRLGSICTLMINKRSGQAEYAVLKSTGGFLGLSERYYPLDWRELTYDARAHGYGVDFSEEELQHREGYDMDGRRLDRDHGRRLERSQSGWW